MILSTKMLCLKSGVTLSTRTITCIKEGAFRRTPRITESGRESERTGETDGLTKDMR